MNKYKKITKEELILRLVEIAKRDQTDFEVNHVDADKLLLGYINDPRVDEAYNSIRRCYA